MGSNGPCDECAQDLRNAQVAGLVAGTLLGAAIALVLVRVFAHD